MAIVSRSGNAGEIRLVELSYGIVDRADRAVDLVSNCSLTAKRNCFTALVGPSGCGKTTLMNLIAGYIAPTAGKVFLDNDEVVGPSSERLMVFQETALFPWMTTLDNVVYGPMVRGTRAHAKIVSDAAAILERFGLGEFKNRYPHELSGGMQRRGELARALINDPKVLLMDEPFRGLDAMTRQLMQEYLVKLFEDTRTTTVFVTSEIDEAIFLADRLIVLSNAPARAAAVVEVGLPRPRTFEMLSSPAYASLKQSALELLYAEAAAAFSGGASLDLKEAFERRHAD